MRGRHEEDGENSNTVLMPGPQMPTPPSCFSTALHADKQFLSLRQDLTMRGSCFVPHCINSPISDMTKVLCTYVWKCHDETHCFVQIIVTCEGEKIDLSAEMRNLGVLGKEHTAS